MDRILKLLESMRSSYNEEERVWKGYTLTYPYDKNVYLGEKIIECLKTYPKRLLQISHDEQKYLYADEFLNSIIRVGQNLMKLGIKSKDVVGVVCSNSNATSIIINACILIGAPVNPLDTQFEVQDLCLMFNQTRPKLVFCDSDVYQKVKNSLENIKSDAKIITNGDKVEDITCYNELVTSTGIEDEFESPKFDELAHEKTIAIICSSGTTGFYKGVCLSHAFFISHYGNYELNYELETLRTSLSLSSPYWITGFYANVMIGMPHKEVRVVTKQKFTIDLLIELLMKYEITRFFASPSQLIEMIYSEKLNNFKSKLAVAYSGGSMITEHVRQKFRNKFSNVRLLIVYSTTECYITLPYGFKPQKENSVGNMLMANIEVKIVDDDGTRLGIGEKGEIRVKSATKFLGYYGNLEASKDAFDDEEFFKTGDIGYFDEDRNLYVIDRKKDVLKNQGYHYNPSEIEAVIQLIEGVKCVSVVGVQDKFLSFLATAVIVKQDGFEDILTEDSVKNFVASKLPNPKHLHGGVIFVDKLPMTVSGKIQRRKVLEMISKQNLI